MVRRLKFLGVFFAVAVCAALAVDRGLAQEDVPNAGTERAAPRGDGSGGNGAVRGATEASRKGAAAPTGGPGATAGAQGLALDHGNDPIRLEGGLAGLQRRANRKALTANAPKTPAGAVATTGIGAPSLRAGADGGVARNAIGIVTPGGAQGTGRAAAGFMPQTGGTASGPGIGASRPGAVGGGMATTNPGGAGLGRSAVPFNAVTAPIPRPTGINGTNMGHIASGPSSVGGPAKDRSVINGTTIRPKH